MIKKLLLGLLILTLPLIGTAAPKETPKAKGFYLCTGFIISADGYIGTAGHCAGSNEAVYLTVNGKVVRVPARIVDRSVANDTMIIKVDVNNLTPFSLSMSKLLENESIAYIGYPNPDKYGWFKHTFKGRVDWTTESLKYVLYWNLIGAKLWSDHGASGSCVYNSSSACVGILTAGLSDSKGKFLETGLKDIIFLIQMAVKNNIAVTLNYDKPKDISPADLSTLYKNNIDKVVLITFENPL